MKNQLPKFDNPVTQHYAGRVAEFYNRHRRARRRAFTETDWEGFAALAKAVTEEYPASPFENMLDEVLTAMTDSVDPKYSSTVLQPLPAPVPELPKGAIDPVTGAQLPNPLDEDDPKRRARLTADLRAHRPELLKHFEEIQRRPMEYLAEFKAKQDAAVARIAEKHLQQK
jgi:hypothetical protein